MSDTALPAAGLPAAAPARRRGWVTVVLCLLIFGGGAVVGAGATALFVGSRVREAVMHPEAAPHRIAERLRRKLDLSDEQAGRIEQSITELHAQILAARGDFLDRIEPILDEIEAAISTELPPGKRGQFQKQFAEVRDEWLPRAAKKRRGPR